MLASSQGADDWSESGFTGIADQIRELANPNEILAGTQRD